MVKVISLSNEAYTKLKMLKGEKSFSDIVIEIIERKKSKKNLMDFFGIWKEDNSYWENFNKKVREDRNKAKLREVNF